MIVSKTLSAAVQYSIFWGKVRESRRQSCFLGCYFFLFFSCTYSSSSRDEFLLSLLQGVCDGICASLLRTCVCGSVCVCVSCVGPIISLALLSSHVYLSAVLCLLGATCPPEGRLQAATASQNPAPFSPLHTLTHRRRDRPRLVNLWLCLCFDSQP